MLDAISTRSLRVTPEISNATCEAGSYVHSRPAQLRAKRLQREADGWHEVDRKLTPEQIAQLPAGDLKIGDRSAAIWMEYFHHALGWVTAQGCYFFDSGRWMARYKPEEFRNIVKQVDAVAWVPIRSAVKPCKGSSFRNAWVTLILRSAGVDVPSRIELDPKWGSDVRSHKPPRGSTHAAARESRYGFRASADRWRGKSAGTGLLRDLPFEMRVLRGVAASSAKNTAGEA